MIKISVDSLFSRDVLSVLHCHFELLFSQLLQIHDLFLQLAFLTQPFEDHHVEFRYFLFAFWNSVLHCKKRFDDEIQLLWYFVNNFFNFRWNINLLLFFIFSWLLFLWLFDCLLCFIDVLLLLNSAGCVFQLSCAFNLWNMLVFRAIKNVDIFNLVRFEVGFPDHSKRVTSSGGKVVTIFWKSTGIGTSIMAIESVLNTSSINLPNLDLWVKRSCDHIVIFGVEVYFGHGFSMSIIVLNQPFASKVIQFYFFISWARG